MINTILEKCVVDQPEKSLASARDLRLMVDAFVEVVEQGGQLLQDEVPRPCHVCGSGIYRPELLRRDGPAFNLRLWHPPGGSDISVLNVRIFVCSSCGHTEFFRN